MVREYAPPPPLLPRPSHRTYLPPDYDVPTSNDSYWQKGSGRNNTAKVRAHTGVKGVFGLGGIWAASIWPKYHCMRHGWQRSMDNRMVGGEGGAESVARDGGITG